MLYRFCCGSLEDFDYSIKFIGFYFHSPIQARTPSLEAILSGWDCHASGCHWFNHTWSEKETLPLQSPLYDSVKESIAPNMLTLWPSLIKVEICIDFDVHKLVTKKPSIKFVDPLFLCQYCSPSVPPSPVKLLAPPTH